MDRNSEEFIKMFHSIAGKGYIRACNDYIGSIGLTYEKEIGKIPDSKYLPDYNDIEIKCTSRYSEYPLYLFTVALDSEQNDAIRLANLYGYKDPDFPDKNVLFGKVENYINSSKEYNFKFDVDKENKKIYLCVLDSYGNLIERKSYIYFSSIIKHIDTKLSKVAYIKASVKKENKEKFYRYYALYLLKFKGFYTLIKLIESGKIRVEIIARISKSGNDKGRYRCKNLVFSIYKENIPLLFDCYYQYNYDNNY